MITCQPPLLMFWNRMMTCGLMLKVAIVGSPSGTQSMWLLMLCRARTMLMMAQSGPSPCWKGL